MQGLWFFCCCKNNERDPHSVDINLLLPHFSTLHHLSNLSSYFLTSAQINWDYPTIICTKSSTTISSVHLKWYISLYLRRISKLWSSVTSWSSKWPYHQPLLLIFAKEIKEAWWLKSRGENLGWGWKGNSLNDAHPVISILVPYVLLFTLLTWDPFP